MSQAPQPQLLAKHAAYESLAIHLTKLPRKLTYPGLIPIAPRLYLPGKLVRTNEILVLLGRSGEASYFAERTAWQAHQIVRRRLGHIEHGLRELIAAAEEVSVIESQPSMRKKRVTFRDPVVCASPPLKARPHLSPSPNLPPLSNKHSNDQGEERIKPCHISTDRSQIKHRIHDSQNVASLGTQDRFEALESQYESVNAIPEEYMNVLRAAELDEDSSDDDLEQEYDSDDADDFSQYASKSSDLPLDSRHSQSSKPPATAESQPQSVSRILRDKEAIHEKSIPDQSSAHQEQSEKEPHIKSEFQDALRNAEEQAKEDGLVNLMEFYDGDSPIPSQASLPSHFRPDDTIDFDDDDEAYLDITGKSVKNKGIESPIPADHLEFLREEAKKEEEEQRRKAAEVVTSDSDKRQKKLEKEKKEFGSGFAKGFFGSSSTSSKSPNGVDRERDKLPATHVMDPEVSELQETAPIQERVVERKVLRKSSKRHRKPQTRDIPEVMSVVTTGPDTKETEVEKEGLFTHIEDASVVENPPMSKFKQLRKLKKVSADGSPVR